MSKVDPALKRHLRKNNIPVLVKVGSLIYRIKWACDDSGSWSVANFTFSRFLVYGRDYVYLIYDLKLKLFQADFGRKVPRVAKLWPWKPTPLEAIESSLQNVEEEALERHKRDRERMQKELERLRKTHEVELMHVNKYRELTGVLEVSSG